MIGFNISILLHGNAPQFLKKVNKWIKRNIQKERKKRVKKKEKEKKQKSKEEEEEKKYIEMRFIFLKSIVLS